MEDAAPAVLAQRQLARLRPSARPRPPAAGTALGRRPCVTVTAPAAGATGRREEQRRRRRCSASGAEHAAALVLLAHLRAWPAVEQAALLGGRDGFEEANT